MSTLNKKKSVAGNKTKACSKVKNAPTKQCDVKEEYEPLVIDVQLFDTRTPESDKFWDKFERFLNACGQVASHPNERDIYMSQAWETLGLWQCYALKHGKPFYFTDYGKVFIDSLVQSSDRRKCARDTMRYARPKGFFFTPDEIEGRYQARLFRRAKRR